MKNLLKLAKVHVASVSASAAVVEAIDVMSKATVGAVLVEDGEALTGIFTERDVMLRVVLARKDPETTPVKDVMTSPVESVDLATLSQEGTTPDDVLKTMLQGHFRHLPVLGEGGAIEGMISIRHLLQRRVEDLTREVDSLEAYLTADGIGG